MGFPWLSLLTFLPAIGAMLVLFTGRRQGYAAKLLALACAVVCLLMTVGLWHAFDPNTSMLQFQERHVWIESLHIDYRVGCDGMSLLMLVLSAIVTVIGMLASWRITERVGLYYALVLLLETCLFGAFTALNFVHWFTFWELSLIPAFFLIKLWGGAERSQAATRFLVYTIAGGVAMMLSFVAIYLATQTFDFLELAQISSHGGLAAAFASHPTWAHMSPATLALIAFAGIFFGLAVKVPVIPFHTWLPSAYAEAPTGTTILLTGAMSKMGVYGFLRILLPIFSSEMQHAVTLLLWLAVATIICSSAAALVQKDLKKIFAYSSINHLGYCMLAIFAVVRLNGGDPAILSQKHAALSGALLQMFNHGLTAAAIFWFISLLEERNGGKTGVNDFGGIRKIAPVFTGLMGIAIFSSLGLPGLNGFIGEFLIFKGSFPLVAWATSLSVFGLLLTAIFLLTTMQKVFSGPLQERLASLSDLTLGERLLFAPVIALMFFIGLYPQMILGPIHSTVVQMVQRIQ